jgi:hypothetical protein
MVNYALLQQERPVKSGNGHIDPNNQSMIAHINQHAIRGTQSQSPDNKVNHSMIQSNASANTTVHNQTFYMAERLKKKNNNAIPNRPVSIDDNLNNIVIASTNDSRVEEILPNVSRHSNNKSA